MAEQKHINDLIFVNIQQCIKMFHGLTNIVQKNYMI